MIDDDQAGFIPSRLARLEHQLRMMKIAVLAVLLILSLSILVGMTPTEEQQLSAKGFVLIDDDGKTRARLYVDTTIKGPKLVFYASDSNPALELELEEYPGGAPGNPEPWNASSMTFFDKGNERRIRLSSLGTANALEFWSTGNQRELELASGPHHANLSMGAYMMRTTNQAFPIVLETQPRVASLHFYAKPHKVAYGSWAFPKQIRIRNRNIRGGKVGNPVIDIFDEKSEEFKRFDFNNEGITKMSASDLPG